MSKSGTLATCIAKMYEGTKLDNSNAATVAPKKPSSTLIGSLGNLEAKINHLEGRVDQITNTQTLVLQKLDSLCQGLGAVEKNLAQFRPDAPGRPAIKPTHKDADHGRSSGSATITEVKSLCGETVSLLRSLKQEGQLQRKKIEGIENSVSTMDKVLSFVGEAFRSSKIVDFILSGVVPWRKQGLLYAAEEKKEKNRVDDDATKAETSIYHRGTQTLEEINEEAAVPHEHQEQKVPSPKLLSSSAAGAEEAPLPGCMSKTQRRPKEVTLKSREPDRVQAFAPQSLTEPEGHEGHEAHHVVPAESGSVPEASQLEGVVPEKAGISATAQQPTVDSVVKEVHKREKKDEKNVKTKTVATESGLKAKPHLPAKENQESGSQQKEACALETAARPAKTEAICKSKPKPVNRKTTTETPAAVPEMPKTSKSETEPSSEGGKTDSVPEQTPVAKSAGLDLQFPIIDDCPPHPAPFEHRIVSAKQVPLGSCYTVQPNELLGGGRFGQVHKCAELSSGLTLAAKIIKVKGMKEREEVKNEIGMMNQLNHVNLIQLYDAFESRTNLTLIMEYVEGGELFDRIVDEHYQMTELDAIVFSRQICEGVQYLHQQYILHLDLKPENILCVSSTGNQIKIIDFGLARKYRPREKLKVNFGTPEFLAPEVVNYDFVSFPTDMWSVGVITYMLLSGLSPFLGENDADTMNNILHANWNFDDEAFENVSEEAKDFISRLLVPAKCSRLSASGCMKHSWLNNLEEKAKKQRVRLKSQLRLQRYLAAHRQWKKHFLAVTAANRLKRFQQNRSSTL